MIKFLELKAHLTTIHGLCYNISGDDTFLVQRAIGYFGDKIIMPELNTVKLNAPPIVQLVDECNALPMVSQYRLVIVDSLAIKTKVSTAKKSKATIEDDTQILAKYLSNPNPSTLLIFANCDIPKFDGVVDIDCNKLDAKSINAWIVRECRKTDSTIQADAASLLINYCDYSLQRISSEVAKLCHYKAQDTISVQDVRLLVRPDISFKIFELSQAVASREVDKAMIVLQNLTQNGEEQVALLGLLYTHFRRLLFVLLNKNDSQLASKLGIKDYAITMLKKQAPSFNPSRLRQILGIFWAIDIDFRAGKFPLEHAVSFVISKLV